MAEDGEDWNWLGMTILKSLANDNVAPLFLEPSTFEKIYGTAKPRR